MVHVVLAQLSYVLGDTYPKCRSVKTPITLYSPTDITSNDVKLPELFDGANQDPWYWLLSLIQLINRSVSIAISGLDCMVRISEFELDKQSLCNSYITSNGLCSDGIAKGILCSRVCIVKYY